MMIFRSHISYSKSIINGVLLIFFCLVLLSITACSSTGGPDHSFMAGTRDPGPVWPPPPQETRVRFLGTIAGPSDMGIKKSWLQKSFATIFGERENSAAMLRPYSVFADADGIFVTDPGISAVHIFDLTKTKYFHIRKSGGKTLKSPIGIAADQDAVYFTDSVLRKVFVFDRKGNYQRDIGTPEIFKRPAGIAVDKERIYVVDTLGNKVFVFAKDGGRLLSHFGKNGSGHGEFHYPTNIFIGKDGLLYITDSLNFRIQIFDKDGNFVSAFGRHGNSSGDFSKPKGISVDSDGHIYVADADFDNIQIFDRDGRLLLFFGSTGREKGEMFLPAGVFIDAMDRIYVADSYNKRVQIFRYLKGGNNDR